MTTVKQTLPVFAPITSLSISPDHTPFSQPSLFALSSPTRTKLKFHQKKPALLVRLHSKPRTTTGRTTGTKQEEGHEVEFSIIKRPVANEKACYQEADARGRYVDIPRNRSLCDEGRGARGLEETMWGQHFFVHHHLSIDQRSILYDRVVHVAFRK